MVPWRATDALALLLAAALTPIACILAVASWLLSRGAIMQVVLEPAEKP
jgi:hypothetical protein